MKLASLFACLVALASASQPGLGLDSPRMNPGSICLWGGSSYGGMTCQFLAHTSYDNAFTLIASLPACASSAAVQASQSPSNCYHEDYCMFCFGHSDEYYLLEESMGVVVPTCKVGQSSCPKAADIHSWDSTGLLHKVHNFWGSRAIPLPREFSD